MCVVSFADGTLCRMTTHCHDDALDWERGINLCKAAWCSRRDQPMVQAPRIFQTRVEFACPIWCYISLHRNGKAAVTAKAQR